MPDSAADKFDTGPKNSAELHAAFVGPAETAAMGGRAPAQVPQAPQAAAMQPVNLWRMVAIMALVLVAIVAGLLIPHWGWLLLAAVSLYFAWTLIAGWNAMTSVQRLMRAATLLMAIALTIVTALPR